MSSGARRGEQRRDLSEVRRATTNPNRTQTSLNRPSEAKRATTRSVEHQGPGSRPSGCGLASLEVRDLRRRLLEVAGGGWVCGETEKHLSDMVVSNALVAKIDRPIGIICFQTVKDSNDCLNSWAMNLEKLLDLVEKSCHQIHKETMVHKAALKV
ncbi:26S proteasome regulatory subunit, putative [Actinidia rufa]|uniref:26S proteasome regulatory subunit, putative n=1 Tax=Actinidia rufa TaxID=165716 RepID=A0A7J0F652_9ERIC|nr:26S proteasome regulatory subunit, putative [Actinidia rufa]